MRCISRVAAAAALVSIAVAGNAPAIMREPIGDTYSANLPNTGGITGAIKGSAAPNGQGTSFQITFYNLPTNEGNLTYTLHTGRVGSNNDCSTAGAVLDPYAGVTGTQCATKPASCQVGDLSDKHGNVKISTGGSGTGYFAANYVDDYVSMEPSDKAFFGHGSIVIADGTGAAIACANFLDANAAIHSTKNSTMTATTSSGSMTASMSQTRSAAGHASTSGSASSTSSGSGAARSAGPVIGAGLLGMAALLI